MRKGLQQWNWSYPTNRTEAKELVGPGVQLTSTWKASRYSETVCTWFQARALLRAVYVRLSLTHESVASSPLTAPPVSSTSLIFTSYSVFVLVDSFHCWNRTESLLIGDCCCAEHANRFEDGISCRGSTFPRPVPINTHFA